MDEMLDTDQLKSFVAIVDTGSFTRAAEQVHKTQSAVSMNIRKIEEMLGKKLFLKDGRGVKLSTDGEKLIDYARDILKLEAQAMHSLSGKSVSGHVRFGIPDDYCGMVMPDIMAAFSRRYPLAEISVVCEPSIELKERILARDLDLAVVTAKDSIGDVEIIQTSRLQFVAAQNSDVHRARPLPLAVDSGYCEWRSRVLENLAEAGVSFRTILESKNYAAIDSIVAAGLAVAILPEKMVRSYQKIVGRESGLPEIGESRIGLIASQARAAPVRDALATIIRQTFGSH